MKSQTENSSKPKVVCLCGSTRFYDEFQKANYLETINGHIVLSVGFYPHSQTKAHGEEIGILPEQKEDLDELHLRKIDLADEVLILNVGGYIGESTNKEMLYAFEQGKEIRFLEPHIFFIDNCICYVAYSKAEATRQYEEDFQDVALEYNQSYPMTSIQMKNSKYYPDGDFSKEPISLAQQLRNIVDVTGEFPCLIAVTEH